MGGHLEFQLIGLLFELLMRIRLKLFKELNFGGVDQILIWDQTFSIIWGSCWDESNWFLGALEVV